MTGYGVWTSKLHGVRLWKKKLSNMENLKIRPKKYEPFFYNLEQILWFRILCCIWSKKQVRNNERVISQRGL